MPLAWDQRSLHADLSEVPLDEWRWLLPAGLKPLLVTPFGDVFFTDAQRGTHFLDTIWGELVPVPGGLEGLRTQAGAGEPLDEWFRDELLADLLARDVKLGQGDCYHFTVPPVSGGEYEPGNVEVGALALHLGLMGQLHRQLAGLPEGTPIDRFADASDDES